MNKSVIEDLSSGNLLTNIHVETSNRYYKKQEDTSAPLRNRKTAFLIQKTDFLGQTGSPDPSKFSGGSTGYISKKKEAKSSKNDSRYVQLEERINVYNNPQV